MTSRVRLAMTAALVAGTLAVGACTSPSSATGSATAGGIVSGPSASVSAVGVPPLALDGLGDPYFPRAGNGGYDVGAYDLAVTYDVAARKLTGTATISATPTVDLRAFHLDLHGLVVAGVSVNGVGAGFRRDADELIITPTSALAKGVAFTVIVRYSGQPLSYPPGEHGPKGFLATDTGAVVIGEPFSAATWFPVNDYPTDKATYKVAVTVPAGYSAITNGVPGKQQASKGWTTWHWSVGVPMASYLLSVAIGRYTVTTSTHDGKPVLYAVATSNTNPLVMKSLERTPEIADYLATIFGPYPFETYGGVVVDSPHLQTSLESQGRPFYTDSFRPPTGNVSLVVHELAHQWFGDSVSVRSWRDIWLSEGFATYAQLLWTEHSGGQTAEQGFARLYAQADDEIWTVRPGDPGPAIFQPSVYVRGAMTLHVLRRAVGDDAFFRILRTWTQEHRYGNASTEDFIVLSERVSGKSLRALFDAWLYQPTKPAAPV